MVWRDGCACVLVDARGLQFLPCLCVIFIRAGRHHKLCPICVSSEVKLSWHQQGHRAITFFHPLYLAFRHQPSCSNRSIPPPQHHVVWIRSTRISAHRPQAHLTPTLFVEVVTAAERQAAPLNRGDESPLNPPLQCNRTRPALRCWCRSGERTWWEEGARRADTRASAPLFVARPVVC
jgi:hypothetical protein